MATRRSFFGFIFGAAAALPELPELAKAAMVAAPTGRPRTTRCRYPIEAIRDRNVLLTFNDYAGVADVSYRGVPIRVVDNLTQD